MSSTVSQQTLDAIDRHAVRDDVVSAAVEMVGDRRVVLLGEATHGTREFYRLRAEITRRLVEEKGFAAVAAEADWPDALRASRWAMGEGGDGDAEGALGGFDRFPLWMWRNREVEALVDWMRGFNAGRARGTRVGFFGLDLYSLHRSAAEVVEYLERVDPEAAARARERYACLGQQGDPDDGSGYGRSASLGLRGECRADVLRTLAELRERAMEEVRRDGLPTEDEAFFAERNAEVVRGAEAYYREMYEGTANTWNLRDTHMDETLAALERHLGRTGRAPKVVVWAHNSHIGDARATGMGWRGDLNLGQLARERLGEECFLLGFTTHEGTVTCAEDWGDDAALKRVRPSMPDSVEHALHLATGGRGTGSRADQGGEFLLDLREPALAELGEVRPQRMIGVVYRPRTERISHYVECEITRQFDAVIHVDRSSAVEPLDEVGTWRPEAVAETWPSGL